MLGTGIIKGLIETARNFFGSYYDRSRLTTVQYPEQTRKVPENYRNFPFLVYDGENQEKGLRCVSCKICEKECPPQCIYIVHGRDSSGKPVRHPEIFDIDISVCMSCQICVEVCPFDAIKMDQVFELSRADRFEGLLMRKKDLAKSNQYYHQIRPTEAEAVDGQLAMERAQQAASKAKAAAAMQSSNKPHSMHAPTVRPPATGAPVATTPIGSTPTAPAPPKEEPKS